jgi:hypothetical protein
VSAWTALLGPRTAYALGRTAERLPTVVFWYTRDQAVDVASQLIAYLLNRRPAAYARGSGRAGAVG